MKAILLAGGRGTRISRYVGEKPKCTLDIGGISLIRNTVEMLLKNNIEVSIVVGYNKEMVINSLVGLNVKYYYNPFYDVTNSIASLWFAKKELCGEDIIIANADVFWEQKILEMIIATNQEQVMLMDTSKDMGLDYLFKCEGTNLIAHGKELEEYTGEYVGIAKINKSFLNKFTGRLETLIERQKHSYWWENILYSFIEEIDINVLDINGLFWSEIDFIEDYNRIVDYRKNNILQEVNS